MLAVAGLSQTKWAESLMGWVPLIQYDTSDTFAFVLLSCLFCAALWSPAGMFYCVFVTFPYGILSGVNLR